ncbi:membrane hypothetical protein [Candidatus Desulfarcum epimagneticum]|uniref:Vitamin K epoxide reductase domain-containing protein n=1 Tax=uncultured Desulfobacteraceae bacterium TaxID=218296 RepID=A0A484HHR3_9BACT|nr:membrane hypothetical protein [uncultured Desulfobacteraceae bacterium]
MMEAPARFRLAALLLSMAGALYCLASKLGLADRVCFSEGCGVYTEFEVLGFSLYLWGAGAFFLLALLSAFKKDVWAWRLSLAFVIADCGLLTWLAFGPPCSGCMMAGLFFILVFCAQSLLRKALFPWASFAVPAVVAALWIFAFSPSVFSMARDGLMQPWPIYGGGPVKVFFSPTCPSCVEIINDIADMGESEAGFYPIAKNPADGRLIARMDALIRQGQNIQTALSGAGSPSDSTHGEAPDAAPPETPPKTLMDALKLKWRLLKNKARLFQMGFKTVPAVIGSRIVSPKQTAPRDLNDFFKHPGAHSGECDIFSNTPCR